MRLNRKIQATSCEIEEVWKSLNKEKLSSGSLSDRRAKQIADAGWLYLYEIEDITSSLEFRFGWTWLAGTSRLLKRIGIEDQYSFPAEWKCADDIIGDSKYSSSDVLRYFWWLERLGFDLDLGPLSDLIADTLPKTKFLSESHLDVLLYRKEKFTQPPIELCVEGCKNIAPHRALELATENGVTVKISYDEDGNAISLVSTAPRYSPPKEQVNVTCPDCEMRYTQGRRADEIEHAAWHRTIVEPLNPKSSRAWKRAVEADPEAVWVGAHSPKWMHVAMSRRARAFKREFGYDFVQWSDAPQANVGGVAFAFLDKDYRMIGGCRFQMHGGANGRNRLSWIWFCPKARRKGHLTKVWARLLEKMGDFDLEPPVSPAMQAYMRGMNKGNQDA